MIDRIRAEGYIPGELLVHHHAMGPGSHQQPLRRPVLARHGGEVARRRDRVGVVPAAAVDARDVGVVDEMALVARLRAKS